MSLSPREAVVRSLELAQIAVRLDAQKDDPSGAIIAYARSVALLDHIIDVVAVPAMARQDEIDRVKVINDTYSQRMRLLSETYGIPVIRLTPHEAYNYSGRAEEHARL